MGWGGTRKEAGAGGRGDQTQTRGKGLEQEAGRKMGKMEGPEST